MRAAGDLAIADLEVLVVRPAAALKQILLAARRRRQAEQASLSRAEALRQAELALIDGPGFVADGKPLFSYAHPIFWAPFAVIGDGGGQLRS